MNTLANTLSTQVCPTELRYEPRVICGFRPVRELHLGFHFGVLQHMIVEQNRRPGSNFCLIADWHATTAWSSGPNMQRATLTTAAALLALGIDPHKTVLFAQSHVTGLGEMAWLLSCMTPESLLLRNAALRNSPVNQHNIGAILYPVLMAADILSLRGTKIIVNRDQIMNVRKIRQIARAANRFLDCPLFAVPNFAVRGDTVPGIDGTQMEAERENHIPLFLGFRDLMDRVQQIQPGRNGSNPGDPEQCTVFKLYSMTAPPARVQELKARYLSRSITHDDAKRELAFAIAERYALPLQKFEEWMQHLDDIRDILRKGAQVASNEVNGTIALLREKLGLAL